MGKIKILGLIIIILGFTHCKSVKFDKHPPFKITKAIFNNWVGGMPGTQGTKVFIGYTATTDVAFDSLFFANRKTKVELLKNNNKTHLIAYFNTSTVNSKEDLFLYKNGSKELKNKIPNINKFPFELKKNEAVISYKKGNKVKYFKIMNVKKKKSIFYK